ncbi:putative EamA-like transporter family protein [Candidatus Protochlamydia naegleriophila]|uniref:Putative EamA-like transporter family protein n=1 Tax=Candidatus Protochlamydia naegleriophila TaxID=389348 RepID=A0A0U5JE27_9BACT|nr:DMT family transporter [Candidatus Protochlamydia naegleriophila]CUI17774.1 putative EamA-like transporter family protein [Candidatus Protochlamydia naegleriophila]
MVIYTLPQPNILKGSSYALLAFFLMAIFGVLTKSASVEGSIYWVSLLTYATGLALMFPMVYKEGVEAFRTSHIGYHLGRVGFGLAASLLYTLSLREVPLVNATLLFNAAPLFIPILSLFMLKQKVSMFTWWAVLVGFIGIVIIIKPTASIVEHPGNVIGLASGISLAIAYVFIKMLSPTDSIERIVFYFFFFSTCIQLLFLPSFSDQPPSWHTIGFSLAAGIAFYYAQMSLAKAYEYATAPEVGTFQYSSVVFVGILDWMIWKQVPPISDLLGVLLVIVAGFLIMKNSNLSKKVSLPISPYDSTNSNPFEN